MAARKVARCDIWREAAGYGRHPRHLARIPPRSARSAPRRPLHLRDRQWRGLPMSGVRTGVAMPTNTITWWPPGLAGFGFIRQLFVTHTLPDGSIATPVLRTNPSNP